MFDPKTLLDSFLGANRSGMSGNAGDVFANRGGLGGGSAGGILGDLVTSLGSPEGIREKAGQAADIARNNPLAAGALLAGILGTGAGRGVAGSAIKLGGLAAIASMAYKAYQDHQAGRAPQQAGASTAGAEPEFLPPPPNTPFDPASAPQGEDQFALALIRAMIAAAKADGRIDDEERARIGDRLKLAGLDEDAEQFMRDEFAKPIDLDDIVSQIHTEAQRVELFTAARLAIEADSRAERGFLDQLAGRLGLEDALIAHVEATVSAAKGGSNPQAPKWA